jgi:hypothetical protein
VPLKELRHQAAQAGYEGGFVEHYLLPILYPGGLGCETHVLLGLLVVVLNTLVYGWVLQSFRGETKEASFPRREPANGQHHSQKVGA